MINFFLLQADPDLLFQELAKAGYKTIGVCLFEGDPSAGKELRPRFLGLLPMLDPPRHDSASTLKNIFNAGVPVKMITGDHVNIAKETARLLGLGQNIYPGTATRENDPFYQV